MNRKYGLAALLLCLDDGDNRKCRPPQDSLRL